MPSCQTSGSKQIHPQQTPVQTKNGVCRIQHLYSKKNYVYPAHDAANLEALVAPKPSQVQTRS